MTENLRPLKGNNRHPVDELGEVREEIKTLQAREKELKAVVAEEMGNTDSLGGDEWIARQKVTQRKGTWDEKRLKEALGDMVERYRKEPTAVYSIETRRRSEAAG